MQEFLHPQSLKKGSSPPTRDVSKSRIKTPTAVVNSAISLFLGKVWFRRFGHIHPVGGRRLCRRPTCVSCLRAPFKGPTGCNWPKHTNARRVSVGPCLSLNVSDPHYSLPKGQKPTHSFNCHSEPLRLVGF